MINLLRAAYRGARNEIQASGGGWFSSFGSSALQSPSVTTPSGKNVTVSAALASSVVFDCVRKNAQVLAGMPLQYFEKDRNGNDILINDGDLYGLLTESPNPNQTALEFWEGCSTQLSLKGNAYNEKLFVGNRLVGLQPLFGVQPMRDRNRGGFKYGVYDRGKWESLPPEKVFHLRGFGAGDGLGMSTVAYGATSIGSALAADETASKLFSNSMMMAGFLTADQVLTPEQRVQLQDMLATFSGSTKAGKSMILEAGLKWNATQLNPDDAQLLETRRYSVEDICRWFGIPPIIVGHSAEGQTMWGSGVETILLSWLTLGINPMANRIEARVLRDLQPIEKRRRGFFRFDRDAMLQMDSKAKGEFLQKMATSGTLTANERRGILGRPRHSDPNADALLAQTAMAPLDQLGVKDK